MGLGNSTIVGIGGDPVVGSSFVDILGLFQDDPETEYVVMVGEIGGDEEEKAAAFIEAEMTKPVVAYIAGFTAPPGKTMGHAGAIISGSSGTAEAKKQALEAKGIRVGRRRPRRPSSPPSSLDPSGPARTPIRCRRVATRTSTARAADARLPTPAPSRGSLLVGAAAGALAGIVVGGHRRQARDAGPPPRCPTRS